MVNVDKINVFYLRCNNCKKIIAPLYGIVKYAKDVEILCTCEIPSIAPIINSVEVKKLKDLKKEFNI